MAATPPAVEARLKAEQAKNPLRDEARGQAALADAWFDLWYKAKFGRSSPREEARLRAEGR